MRFFCGFPCISIVFIGFQLDCFYCLLSNRFVHKTAVNCLCWLYQKLLVTTLLPCRMKGCISDSFFIKTYAFLHSFPCCNIPEAVLLSQSVYFLNFSIFICVFQSFHCNLFQQKANFLNIAQEMKNILFLLSGSMLCVRLCRALIQQ